MDGKKRDRLMRNWVDGWMRAGIGLIGDEKTRQGG